VVCPKNPLRSFIAGPLQELGRVDQIGEQQRDWAAAHRTLARTLRAGRPDPFCGAFVAISCAAYARAVQGRVVSGS
jgi:hypothetical protein